LSRIKYPARNIWRDQITRLPWDLQIHVETNVFLRNTGKGDYTSVIRIHIVPVRRVHPHFYQRYLFCPH